MMKVYDRLYENIRDMEIIDTHEHLPHTEDARERNTDILREYMIHYFNRDLVSAGLRMEELEKVRDCSRPIMERWLIAEQYWENARHTGYGRALDITVKELYGIDRICRSTIECLNEAFMKTFKPGHFEKVLKTKSKIKVSLLDSNLDCDRHFFRSVFKMDPFIFPCTGNDISYVEKESGMNIRCFDDWLDACGIVLDKAFKAGAVALKSGLAYKRSLKYEKISRSDAEDGFNIIFKTNNYIDRNEQAFLTSKPFQDYMMHYVLRLADKRNLTYQFHTGLQEGNGNLISNSDPSLLSNLFMEYPNVDFDLFHIGYPYQNLLSALAKNFRNVFIDMCWAHIISPAACVNALYEWIDSVPVNKISAFGGDYCFVDAVYGHQYLARMNVSKALAMKVEEGVFDEERAIEIANMLFYKNPYRIFKLEGKI